MNAPWNIDGQAIEQWASRIEAAALLPELLRRLVWASGPVQHIEARADSGTRLGGWDMVTLAGDGQHGFCPHGLAVWELSVQKQTAEKLDSDFEKRIQAPPPPIRDSRQATYVALMARRFPSKQTWMTEKKRAGHWADVKAFDADDLAMWLARAPTVARWFAGKLGLPMGDLAHVLDVESFLRNWSNRTHPPLPTRIALAGQDRQKAQVHVRTWLATGRPSALHLWGETKEEAIVFAAAALAQAPREERERWLARAAVVESREAWRWMTSVAYDVPPILLPHFEGFSPAEAVGRGFVVVPGEVTSPGKGAVPASEPRIELEPIPRKPMAEELRQLGMSETDAERLARESGGKLSVLQRRCGHAELPEWTTGVERKALFAMLWAGAWEPAHEGDQSVLQRLGANPEDVEFVCNELSRRPEQPIIRDTEKWGGGVWRWSAPVDAWHALASGLTDSQIQTFRSVVLEVLGETDPRYELSKAERWYAAVHGKLPKCSESLREGLARSIVHLALNDSELAKVFGAPRGSALAAALVDRLLTPEWKRWASLSRVLPDLAEAAPDAFLSAIKRSLDQGDEGVVHLLAEESDMGASPHTGLLWALEALGWKQDLMPRVAVALARLAENDPGGRLANRPLRSMENLLHEAFPQTTATVDDRLRVLKEIMQRFPEAGWKLALARLQDQRGMGVMFPSYRPRHRDWKLPSELETATDADARKQLEGTVDLMLSSALNDSKKWVDLIEAAYVLVRTPLCAKILEALRERRQSWSTPTVEVWNALRHFRARTQRYARDTGVDAIAAGLYESFEPPDAVDQVAWVFEPTDDHLEMEKLDWRQSQELARQKRAVAVSRLWSHGNRWELLGRLARKSDRSARTLGETLGHSPFADEVEAHILSEAPSDATAKFIPDFIAIHFLEKSKASSWLEAILGAFVRRGARELAVEIALRVQGGMELWRLLERMGEEIDREYWRRVHGIFGARDPDEWEWAVSRLLSAGRTTAAAQTIFYSRDGVAPSTALRVLEAIRDKYNESPGDEFQRLESHVVAKLFELVDRDPSVETQRLATLEIFFLQLLEDTERPARHLYRYLESPAEFVQLLKMLYRAEGEIATPKEQIPEDTERMAGNAYRILSAWDGYPGEELDEEERERRLLEWSTGVLELASQHGRGGVAQIEVAKVLSRVPAPTGDGIWPCRTARELLEKPGMEHFRKGLVTAKRNMRGVWSKGLQEGGKQERALAESFYAGAERLRGSSGETAALLQELGRWYEEDAQREDASARSERLRHGWERAREDDAPSRSALVAQVEAPSSEGLSRLQRMELRNVDVARLLSFNLAPRLNLLAGDNSTGKTLVLDIAWWCLTGTWAHEQKVLPTQQQTVGSAAPAIALGELGKNSVATYFDKARQEWTPPPEWPRPAQSLVIYARVDGTFSVWDPLRERVLDFTPKVLWHGFDPDLRAIVACQGLLRDWVDWQTRQTGVFDVLKKVLKEMSVDDVPLEPGLPTRVLNEDARDYPTLEMPYGRVPVIHASAAVKRVLFIAYLLVWASREHEVFARKAAREPLRQMVLLVDEVESHLHPKWQRLILPAIMNAVKEVSMKLELQVLVSTHSPLVLASLETLFDEKIDKVFRFQFSETHEVNADEYPWAKQGDVINWLLSEMFGMKQARNKQAEEVIKAAEAFMAGEPRPPLDTWEKIDEELRRVLPGQDRFLVRWVAKKESGA